MITKRITLLTLLLLFGLKVWATDFLVTSNADSGTGTLREALMLAAANDSTQTDYIKFNLPNTTEAGRTITLLSQLPDLSANLVVDGTTQPGAKFGVSDAKVKLLYMPAVLKAMDGLRAVNHSDISLFGLYILMGATLPLNDPQLYVGLRLQNGKNIQVGAAGKGNVICRFRYNFAVNYFDGLPEDFYFQNLTIMANMIDVEADGKTTSANTTWHTTIQCVVGQLSIGGAAAEGNVFARGLHIYQINSSLSAALQQQPATVLIKNNKIGVDYNGDQSIPRSVGFSFKSPEANSKNTVNIEDNVINADGHEGIYLINIGRKVTVVRNYIGTNQTRQKNYTGTTAGISAEQINDMVIGTANAAEANYIANCENAVDLYPNTNATVNKNSFYCITKPRPMHSFDVANSTGYPEVSIGVKTGNTVSGTATRLATVELFTSDNCGTCSPQTYVATTTADIDGKWSYTGALNGTIIASATSGKNTSDFTTTSIISANIRAFSYCDGADGYITGARTVNATSVKWVNENGNVVGTTLNLYNVPKGKYTLIAENGNCTAQAGPYEIRRAIEFVDNLGFSITDATCGNSDGRIKGGAYAYWVVPGTMVKWYWTNQNGVKVDIKEGLPAGSYYVVMTSEIPKCQQVFGPYVIKNIAGPNVNDSGKAVTASDCLTPSGSITGITVTGTPPFKYSWKNEMGTEVGTSADLFNVGVGKYVLEVTDALNCGKGYSGTIVIPEKYPIAIKLTYQEITPTTCGNVNGAIKGITTTGATQFKWVNSADPNTTLATTLDLVGVPSGTYIFTASNSFGCSQSGTYVIDAKPPTQYPNYWVNKEPACYGTANGSLEVIVDTLVVSQRWVNSQGNNIGIKSKLINLTPGTYRFFVTDTNGCESLFGTYVIDELPQLKIVPNSETIINETCAFKNGSIKNIQVTGGSGTYKYEWRNSSGTIFAYSGNVDKLAAGTYTLTAYDLRNCSQATASYAIANTDNALAAPVVNNISVCSPGEVTISVQNPSAQSGYRLYDSPVNGTLIKEQAGGVFKINVKAAVSYYISQFTGTCESPRAEAKITVGLTALNIANTFTPNGDGINDFWKITGIENNPTSAVAIFNRAGQKVFESVGYKTPFDGTYQGKPLPTGAYYYTLNMGGACGLVSGSLTVIR